MMIISFAACEESLAGGFFDGSFDGEGSLPPYVDAAAGDDGVGLLGEPVAPASIPVDGDGDEEDNGGAVPEPPAVDANGEGVVAMDSALAVFASERFSGVSCNGPGGSLRWSPPR